MNQELNNETKIFRFVNFFECYEILNSKKLRFQKLASMEDENEGLGSMLYIQQDFVFGFKVSDNKKIDKYLLEHKNNTFISSWTIENDLVALWSLYSQDHCSVRIETTVGKLKEITNKYFDNNYHKQGFELEPNDKRHVCYSKFVEKVIYADLYKLHAEIKSHWDEMYKEAIQSFNIDNNSYDKKLSEQIFEKYKDSCKIIEPNSSWRLKDISYKHENEVRANLDLALRDHLPLDSTERNAYVFGALKHAPPDYFDDSIFLDTQDNFIESVCIDPRCPEFKKKQMVAILNDKFDINITTSRAFGYALDKYNFSIRDI